MKNIKWNTYKKELLKDPAVSAEIERLQPEFELARQVISFRIKDKMTQNELAKKAGTNQVIISRIENASENPSIATMEKICKALGKKLEIKLA